MVLCMFDPLNPSTWQAAAAAWLAQQAIPGLANTQAYPVVGIVLMAFGIVLIAAGVAKALGIALVGIVLIIIGLILLGIVPLPV